MDAGPALRSPLGDRLTLPPLCRRTSRSCIDGSPSLIFFSDGGPRAGGGRLQLAEGRLQLADGRLQLAGRDFVKEIGVCIMQTGVCNLQVAIS